MIASLSAPWGRAAGDQKAGDTNGQGLDAFGGGWDVVSPAGSKIEGSGSGSASTSRGY